MSAGVWEAIDDDKSKLAAMNDEIFGAILLLQSKTKNAALGFLCCFIASDVGHTPGGKEAAHRILTQL